MAARKKRRRKSKVSKKRMAELKARRAKFLKLKAQAKKVGYKLVPFSGKNVDERRLLSGGTYIHGYD